MLAEAEIKRVLKERVGDKKITCAEAFGLAKEFKISLKQMGEILDECSIKITRCQLGCF